ncbi:hypothetical protein [Candidatus Venteria ishoeyi]|uniref:Type I restriction enzyme R protein N-terminal domain-containing protein n=1 Tax=Candidatus Venteria ishoeyi TaxID=1899563 RepID=A0A1H6FG19_9GAMM|nr:hypothetical protein [Candidatus Venteria ishoeyi]MDM8548240.1 hypothetical protein [Candidatus Venteria ishoeyi]SEH09020.1 Uncharacterised protein [Candidatus Venteria ishoeyi]
MSYSDFSIADLQDKFQLTFIEDQMLFPAISDYQLPEAFKAMLLQFIPLALAIDTEKARSELIVAPFLAQLKLSLKDISLFSGIEFNVDKNLGLAGRCDFIISKSREQYRLDAPIVVMVEAKNDNIKSGIAQCGAEMIAAQRFNAEKNNHLDTIYGCVTTGSLWRFLKLSGKDFYIDTQEYHIQTPEKIAAILVYITVGDVSQ